MSAKDIIGILLFAVGVTVGTLGYRWLGLVWFWIGALSLTVGLLLVLNAVRERKLLDEMRKGEGPGDFGDRHYYSGSSAADSIDVGGGHGDGGD
ncbi:MAG: hypothetical protein HY067_21670 [Betaproteobacteria bacterium]|nr:hypothetical protein [Betaproteobacteria bacterium]